MSIEVRNYNQLPRILSFGPDGLKAGRRVFPYEGMSELPSVEQNRWRSWTGYVMRFRMRSGSRKTYQVYREDIEAIRVATDAIRDRLSSGSVPKVLQDGGDGRSVAHLPAMLSTTQPFKNGETLSKRESALSREDWQSVGLKLLKGVGWVTAGVVLFPFALLGGVLDAQEKDWKRRR